MHKNKFEEKQNEWKADFKNGHSYKHPPKHANILSLYSYFLYILWDNKSVHIKQTRLYYHWIHSVLIRHFYLSEICLSMYK